MLLEIPGILGVLKLPQHFGINGRKPEELGRKVLKKIPNVTETSRRKILIFNMYFNINLSVKVSTKYIYICMHTHIYTHILTHTHMCMYLLCFKWCKKFDLSLPLTSKEWDTSAGYSAGACASDVRQHELNCCLQWDIKIKSHCYSPRTLDKRWIPSQDYSLSAYWLPLIFLCCITRSYLALKLSD